MSKVDSQARRGAAAALALGGFFALVVAPSLASAAGPGHRAHLSPTAHAVVPKAATPSPQCVAARQALDAARANDKAEDVKERATAKSDPKSKAADEAEDKAEKANVKKLSDAVHATCEPQMTAPSAECAAARQALKAAKDRDRTEDATENAAPKDSAKAEAEAEKAQIRPLEQAAKAACGKSRR